MNRHRISSSRSTQRPRRESPLERISLFLERNRDGYTNEMIQQVRRRLFGDVVDKIESRADNHPK